MEIPKNPWGSIVQLYKHPLKNPNITTTFETGAGLVAETSSIMRRIQDVIDKKIRILGLTGQNLLSLPPEVREGQLGSAIKSDSAWKKAYQELLTHLAPELDSEKLANNPEDIPRPDWNSPQFGLESYEFDTINYQLNVKGKFSHSYLSYLAGIKDESGNTIYPNLKLDPMSVAGVLITADDYVLMGFRGGHNYADTLMNIPAGSVEPHSGENPLYESAEAEFTEELGLRLDEWRLGERAGLIAITEDYASQTKRSYAVFRGITDLTLPEIIEKWNSAEDKKEHRRLEFYPNNPNFILDKIKYNEVDYASATTPVSRTVPENHGAMLPQGAINLLAHLAHQDRFVLYSVEGMGVSVMEDFLEGRYKLTP